jgi:hypothetical protein
MAMSFYVRFHLIGDDFTHVLCRDSTVRSVTSLSLEPQYEKDVLYFTEEDAKKVAEMFEPFAASKEAEEFAQHHGLVELARILFKTPNSGVVGSGGGASSGAPQPVVEERAVERAVAEGGGEGGEDGTVGGGGGGGGAGVAAPAPPAALAMPVSINQMWTVSVSDALGAKPLAQPSDVTDETVSTVMRSLHKKLFPSSR